MIKKYVPGSYLTRKVYRSKQAIINAYQDLNKCYTIGIAEFTGNKVSVFWEAQTCPIDKQWEKVRVRKLDYELIDKYFKHPYKYVRKLF